MLMHEDNISSAEASALRYQIQAIDLQKADVARRLNSIEASTGALPCEILYRVFTFLTQKFRKPRARGVRKEHPTADLRRISQVCFSWRQLSLNSPSLWSASLDCNKESLTWFPLLLKRSQSAPVHVKADFASELVLVLNNFGAIFSSPTVVVGSVSVNLCHYSRFKAVEEVERLLFSSRARVESVSFSQQHVCHPNWNGNGLDRHMYRPTAIPIPALGNPDRLRRLELKASCADLSHPYFSQLEWLSVSFLSPAITLQDWIRVLTNLPAIVHLRLEEAITRGSPYPTGQSSNSLSLPQLKTLALLGNLDDGIDEFLCSIKTKRRYSLLLNCNNIVKSCARKPGDNWLLLQGLQQWFNVWNAALPNEVAKRRISVEPSSTHLKIHNQIPDQDLTDEWFRIRLSWKSGPLDHTHALVVESDVFQILRPILKQTHTLCIAVEDCCQSYVCYSGFWHDFEALEALRFLNPRRREREQTNAGCFIKALDNDVERSSTRPLPFLRVISLENESLNFASCLPFDTWHSLTLLSQKVRFEVELFACDGIQPASEYLFLQGTRLKVTYSSANSPRN